MANLNYCCLERADLSHAYLDGAQMLSIRGSCANMEGASLQGCNFEDPTGSRTNLENVNLKGACLEGSNMAGVNLRVANLKDANLKNCNLRAAVLAGADLEVNSFVFVNVANVYCLYFFSGAICLAVICKRQIYVVPISKMLS